MIECKNLTNGLRISTAGAYFACCHTFNHPFKDENGDELIASKHTIQDALNAPSRLKMIEDFNNDIRHPACVVCWGAEDAGFVSKRQRDNQTYRYFETRKDDEIFFLELNLGNTCNLACRICHISASSRWKDFHHVIEPGITEEHLDHYVDKFSKAFKDDSMVWDELMKILPQVRSLDIYGGEPMLMKKQWEILAKSVELGYSKNQQMSFNTNGTIINDKYIDILSSFEQARIGFSIDGIGKRFNYIRYYGDWDVVKENVNTWQVKTAQRPEVKIRFEVCCTISMLNVLYVFEMVDYVIENNLKLMIAFVFNPPHLHIGNMPEDSKRVIIAILSAQINKRRAAFESDDTLTDKEKEYRREVYYQAEKVINTLKLPTKCNLFYWSEFIRQTCELDVLRKQSFKETFPELFEIYKLNDEPCFNPKKLI